MNSIALFRIYIFRGEKIFKGAAENILLTENLEIFNRAIEYVV